MAESEKYQPSPSELRNAESHMDDRQRELTEVREDSLYEGRKRADKIEKKDESLDNYRGYTDEDLEKAKKAINNWVENKDKDWARNQGIDSLGNEINRGYTTVRRILDDLDVKIDKFGYVILPEKKFE